MDKKILPEDIANQRAGVFGELKRNFSIRQVVNGWVVTQSSTAAGLGGALKEMEKTFVFETLGEVANHIAGEA